MFVQLVLRNNSCQCLFSLSSEIIPVNVYSACPQKSFLSMFIQHVLRNHSCQCLFSLSSKIIPVNVYSACPQKSFLSMFIQPVLRNHSRALRPVGGAFLTPGSVTVTRTAATEGTRNTVVGCYCVFISMWLIEIDR